MLTSYKARSVRKQHISQSYRNHLLDGIWEGGLHRPDSQSYRNHLLDGIWEGGLHRPDLYRIVGK